MWADAQRDGRPAEYRWRPLRKLPPIQTHKCTNCHHLLSVNHILTECTSYNQFQQQHYLRANLKDMFNHSPIKSKFILDFINKCSAVAEMGDGLATIHMGRKL